MESPRAGGGRNEGGWREGAGGRKAETLGPYGCRLPPSCICIKVWMFSKLARMSFGVDPSDHLSLLHDVPFRYFRPLDNAAGVSLKVGVRLGAVGENPGRHLEMTNRGAH